MKVSLKESLNMILRKPIIWRSTKSFGIKKLGHITVILPKNPGVNFVYCEQFLILTKNCLFIDDYELKIDVTVEEIDKFEKIEMIKTRHLTG